MRCLDRLIAEHDLIEEVLDLVEKIISRLERNEQVPEGLAAWTVRFFREFADRCHHAKEEEVVFPRLEARGIPREGGPIGVMLGEHEVGRRCISRMDEAAQKDPVDGPAYAAAAREYVALLRSHIFKENNILFRMGRQVLTPEDDQELDRQSDAIEADRKLAGLADQFRNELSDWKERLAG